MVYSYVLPDVQSNTNLGAPVKGVTDVIKVPNQLILRKGNYTG